MNNLQVKSIAVNNLMSFESKIKSNPIRPDDFHKQGSIAIRDDYFHRLGSQPIPNMDDYNKGKKPHKKPDATPIDSSHFHVKK